MRRCPHCGKEIQDEAIYCRFCHEEVEPPLWITNMRKCPYCAEWIDIEAEDCPYCERSLTPAGAKSTAPFVESSVTDLINNIRMEEAEQETFEITDIRASEVESQDDEFESWEKPKESIAEAEPDINAFRSQPMEGRTSLDRLAEFRASTFGENAEKGLFRIPTRALKIIGGLLAIGILGGGLLTLALGPGRSFVEGLMASNPTPTSTLHPQVSSSPTPAVSPTIGESETPTTLTPTPLPPQTGCVEWSEITMEEVGESMCGYGSVRRWFAVSDIPFVAIFSEEIGTFAIIDRTRAYPQVNPGECIKAIGLVEVMGGTRPYINAAGNLEFCQSAE